MSSVDRELRQVLAELSLVSHVSAVSLDAKTPPDASDDIGGKRPAGGIDRRDERKDGVYEVETGVYEEMTFTLKSADHYRRRVASATTDHALREILADAERSLAAFKRQPMPSGDPEFGSPMWKHWVAASPLSDGEIAHKFRVTRQYVNRVRNQYRDAA